MAGRVVTVFGATGQQGGSVARALLGAEGEYKVRAVTRKPESEAAIRLRDQGAEVVTADFDDKESVLRAVTGAYGCFGVTNFWEHMDQDKEEQQGLNIAKACKEAGVQHLVYSGLEHVKKITGRDCSHFDSKARVEEYLQNSGIPFTSVRLAAYCEMFLTYFKVSKIGKAKFAVFLPMGDWPLPLLTIADFGECVHQIFRRKEEFLGKCIGMANDQLTIKEIAAILSKHLGKDIIDGQISIDNYAQLGFPGAKDLANMFHYYHTGRCHRDVRLTNELNPRITCFEDWVIANKEALMETVLG